MAKTIWSSPLIRITAATALAASLGLGAVSSAHADNNKGTIKISLDGTITLPAGASNEPKVGCLPFYVQGYKLVAGDQITISFYAQGAGSIPNKTFIGSQTTTTTNFGSASDPNYGFNAQITATSLANGATLVPGHYEVDITDTLGAISDSDKSKVFKIDDTCAPGGGTPPPGGGTPPPSATPELSSGELLATGLLPVAFLLYRRRRNGRVS